jgi:hypothetical protein
VLKLRPVWNYLSQEQTLRGSPEIEGTARNQHPTSHKTTHWEPKNDFFFKKMKLAKDDA